MATASADSRIYSVARVRDIERTAMSALPEGTLMSRAGAATAQLALSMLGSDNTGSVLVLAGPGNNGGDALEAAALLAQRGQRVFVVLMADPQRLPNDAQVAYQHALSAKVAFVDRFDVTARWSLAIDGLFGIGLARPLRGRLLQRLSKSTRWIARYWRLMCRVVWMLTAVVSLVMLVWMLTAVVSLVMLSR